MYIYIYLFFVSNTNHQVSNVSEFLFLTAQQRINQWFIYLFHSTWVVAQNPHYPLGARSPLLWWMVRLFKVLYWKCSKMQLGLFILFPGIGAHTLSALLIQVHSSEIRAPSFITFFIVGIHGKPVSITTLFKTFKASTTAELMQKNSVHPFRLNTLLLSKNFNKLTSTYLRKYGIFYLFCSE